MTHATTERLRKLAALVTGGMGGERENAEAIFERLLKESGLRREDFIGADERVSRHPVSIATAMERELLLQVIAKVTDNREATVYYTRGKLSPVKFEATEPQAAEIKFLFALYRRALKVESERLYIAFINKHALFAPSPRPSSIPAKPMDPAERARLAAMMEGMANVTPHKALENRNDR
ncbi:hypothetical protein [Asticcacaulis excentricus]|uniref:DUF2786 domain-containing protein n=1 Tax=Asticcacaulis excentricus (strain ATCC 15261 / DSM 4724 / KCTC 12464 / NCIMB 9791 / VKM B-1370 / CB 48) TaxID=573065 RepID=E8RPM6_ASTEC|nr:hypothetical protein [Asticcacaulis excentricus]ADU12003.1 hypothetical protein Astex_0305 [Asticcacaulis excentricus CB 48]